MAPWGPPHTSAEYQVALSPAILDYLCIVQSYQRMLHSQGGPLPPLLLALACAVYKLTLYWEFFTCREDIGKNLNQTITSNMCESKKVPFL